MYKADKLEDADIEFIRARDTFGVNAIPLASAALLYHAVVVYRHQRLDEARSLLNLVSQPLTVEPTTLLKDVHGGCLDRSRSPAVTTERPRSNTTSRFGPLISREIPVNRADTEGLLATCYTQLGAIDLSWQERNSALLESADRPPSRSLQGLLLATAEAAGAQEWLEVADHFQRAALEVARRINHPPDIADTLLRRAVLLKQRGLPSEAKRAVDEARDVLAADSSPGLASLRAELDLAIANSSAPEEIGKAQAAADRAREFYAQNGSADRLPFVYASLARLHRAAGETDRAIRDYEAGLHALEQQVTSAPTADLQTSFEDATRALVNDYVDTLMDKGDTNQAFQVHERAQAGVLRRATVPVPTEPPSLTLLESWLPADALFLSFAVHDDEVVWWTARHGTSRTGRTPVSLAELRRLTAAFAVPSASVSVGVALRRLLVDPAVSDADTGATLVLMLDGPLHTLAFASLPGEREIGTLPRNTLS